MYQLKELLRKYWSGEKNSSAKPLLTILEERESEISDVLRKEFDVKPADENSPLLSEDSSKRILTNIHNLIHNSGHKTATTAKRVAFRLGRIGWAAAIFFLMGLSLLIFRYQNHKKDSLPVVATLNEVKPEIKLVRNTGVEAMEWVLPDSSFVRLYPGSELAYKEGFDETYRSLNLKGKGFFKVAKDASKPFTVYANGVATTALGTEFSVSTLKGADKVLVKLCEGSVVVNFSMNQLDRKDIYLKPGQQCMVDVLNKEALVKNYLVTNKAGSGNKPIISKDISILEFSKEPLSGVFKKLNKQFGVKINYTEMEIKNLSFTGSFQSNDSLEMILDIISRTNDLSFEQEGNQIIIRKNH